MRPSEIFDEFVKLAQEKGLISDDSKKKLENNPRADSLSTKDIEKLYNVKPNTPEDMEYKTNIMELAHKDPTVLVSSYDKLNGLVENDIERQNIIINILNKNNKKPTGQLSNPKYAAQEGLVLSLVRLGNSLDALDKYELTALADVCLEQVAKKKDLNKQAAGFLLPIIGVTASMIGALYIQQHSDFYNQGFQANYQRLMNELNDFLGSFMSNSNWGVGYTYKSSFIKSVKELQSELKGFKSVMDDVMSTINDIRKPKTGKELLEDAKETGNDVQEAYDKLYEAFEEHYTYLDQVKRNFSSQTFKEEQIADKGIVTDLIDRTQFLHGDKGLIADDFDDVVRALGPYIKCIADPKTGYLKLLTDAKSISDNAKLKLMQAQQEVSKAPKWQGEEPKQPQQQPDFKEFSADQDEEDFKNMFGK